MADSEGRFEFLQRICNLAELLSIKLGEVEVQVICRVWHLVSFFFESLFSLDNLSDDLLLPVVQLVKWLVHVRPLLFDDGVYLALVPIDDWAALEEKVLETARDVGVRRYRHLVGPELSRRCRHHLSLVEVEIGREGVQGLAE